MYFTGIIIAICTFLTIGIWHPIVIVWYEITAQDAEEAQKKRALKNKNIFSLRLIKILHYLCTNVNFKKE